MGALPTVSERAADPHGFEICYLDRRGEEVYRPLEGALDVPLEEAPPVRSFPSYRGQRNYPGLYYAATMDTHVGHESWLERDEAMCLDFDPQVRAFSSQPFTLSWPDGVRRRSHVPDFFARTADGTGIVVDCRPEGLIKPKDRIAFDTTGHACERAGWLYRLVTGHEPVRMANLRWIAGYRHRRHRVAPVAVRLLESFIRPRPLVEGAAQAGDPLRVLPVLYYLLWAGELATDLDVRLDGTSLVCGAVR